MARPSGSVMFVYAIQRAVEIDCVYSALYRSVARKRYAGVKRKVAIGPDGLVDIRAACDVVGVEKSYEGCVRFEKVVNAREAVGSVLRRERAA
jgi:rhamnogalacturonyl hydrolase YesR